MLEIVAGQLRPHRRGALDATVGMDRLLLDAGQGGHVPGESLGAGGWHASHLTEPAQQILGDMGRAVLCEPGQDGACDRRRFEIDTGRCRHGFVIGTQGQ